MPAIQLNIDASVPGVDGIRAAPISVGLDSQGRAKLPGITTIDFVPNPNKPKVPDVVAKPVRKPHSHNIIVKAGDPYVSHADSDVEIKRQAKLIKERAKVIFKEHSEDNAKYAQSVQIVKKATEAQLAVPDERLQLALTRSEAGEPMSKQHAIQLATEQLRGKFQSHGT